MIAKILLIEDESSIADNILYALKTEGFDVTWLKLGSEGLDYVRSKSPDVVILDIGLPDISGFEVCKQIRLCSQVPIIFLTARDEEVDRVVGLEIGGDDYVTKPFSPRELAARVRVILRRVGQHARGALNNDIPADLNRSNSSFVIDSEKARIQYFDVLLELTRYEYLILKTLLSYPERVFSREQLMQNVWESPETSLERAVDTHIKSIRAKLREINSDFEPIKTHRGLGYSILLHA